ncbi:carboxypeptidase-like regulatory domain-containing protein [Aureibaculum sp. A20]|uniref:Carboxypeptidase-like regulatory domain-containing protein n=1 Tax=Aureibaculum flavum TaxID=2795986 RepID=A0ABS0WNR7_9FLAO|nr:VIT domain-containing protein [Aureibaculum flavum]MBJ2173630.1 carboxypeptidase-like regulatory domain-containing protein [Aureibaculum flavum]
MKKLIILSFLMLNAIAFTQEAPKVLLKDKSTLKLTDLKVNVNIIGNTATTTYDMKFYNELDRTLEGELAFPLGQGQSVSNFAMEVNGNLRDAVIVEKELARVAFENTVRQNIDPGLLEKTQGNNYKARVYPILPKKHKQIVITYEQQLYTSDNTLQYVLPLNIKETLDSFSLTLMIPDNGDIPKINTENYKNTDFQLIGNAYLSTISKKNHIPNESVTIEIPTNTSKENVATYKEYFYSYKTSTPKTRLKVKPKQITIVWDASLSMRFRNLEKEIRILKEYVEYLENVEIQFISINNSISKNKSFSIVKGNMDSLENEIRAIHYDGGTSFDLSKTKLNKTDEVLLFSDGLSNLGDFKLSKNSPTYCLNAMTSSNHELLEAIATKSGANYINLARLSDTNAINILKQETFQFLGIKPSNNVTEVYPKKNTNVNSSFSISGKFKKNTSIELLFGYNGKVTETSKIDIKANNENKLVKRLWAKKKLAFLNQHKEENKESIISLAKQYHLMTDFTSMLILDRIEDYVKYQIEPPAELKQQYKELVKYKEEEIAWKLEDIQERKEEIFEDYQDILTWYKTKFPKRNRDQTKKKVANTTPQESTPQTTETEVEEEPLQPQNNSRETNDVATINNNVQLDSTKNIISGVVLASDGLPLPGVNVVVKGTTYGTNTDFDGKFALNANQNDELEFSFIGFDTTNYIVENTNEINIKLDESANNLDEVVVVGYGSQRKASITASVSTVVSNALSGKVTGVNVTYAPGASETTQIRGASSIETSQPLYVVDGVVVEVSPMGTLNPEDIDSMSVLKAASASAIYGARAANGVILITTKEGVENNSESIQEFNTKISSKTELQPWNPDEPYIKILEEEKTVEDAYNRYLKIRDEYANIPTFYLDVADFFDKKGNSEIAITVLTNLMEIELDNYELMKALAYKLEYFKKYKMAVLVYEKILELRPEEPQSYRDLALAYEEIGNFKKSYDLLYKIYNGDLLEKDEEELFYGIEHVAYIELSRLVNKYGKKLKLKKSFRKQFKKLPVDIRIVVDWNHKETDLDLWVIDPNKEEAYYKNNETKIGGHMSEDLTEGYGPEEFMLKNAIKGKYKISIDYFTDNVQKISGPTILKITIYRNYGKENESKNISILRLDEEEEEIEVGSITF